MSVKVCLLVVFALVAFAMDTSDNDGDTPMWVSEDDQETPEFTTPEPSDSEDSQESMDEDDYQFSDEEEDETQNPVISDDDDMVIVPEYDFSNFPGPDVLGENGVPVVNETTINRIAEAFVLNITGAQIFDIDRLNLSMEQLIFLFGKYADSGPPRFQLMAAPAVTPCDFDTSCPHGYDTYENLVSCLSVLVNNCTGFEAEIDLLNKEKVKFLCPEHFVDLSGFSDADFPAEVFKNRMKYIRVSIPQKKKFDDKCLENSGRFAVKKISLNCKELQVKTCEIEDKSTLKEVDKAELDRICDERKLEVRDLRSQELSAQLDDFVLNSNASAVCLVIDKQQLSELSEYLRIARLEAIVHVPVKSSGDFKNQIAKPDFAVSGEYHYAIFESGNFIGSGGLVSIYDAKNNQGVNFGVTAKHVVKSATSIWMCNSQQCYCASVIVPPKPIKGHQSDIAFLYAPEFEKISSKPGPPALHPLDEKSKLEVVQIDGFLQHDRKINPTAVTVRYSRASTEVEDYKYLLLDYHHSMQEGLSGSLVTNVMVSKSYTEIVGVFTGTWNKYFWESASRGMMAWVTKADIEYLLEYNIQRNPSCKGSGSIIGERYRDVVADKVDSWVASATRYLREGN